MPCPFWMGLVMYLNGVAIDSSHSEWNTAHRQLKLLRSTKDKESRTSQLIAPFRTRR